MQHATRSTRLANRCKGSKWRLFDFIELQDQSLTSEKRMKAILRNTNIHCSVIEHFQCLLFQNNNYSNLYNEYIFHWYDTMNRNNFYLLKHCMNIGKKTFGYMGNTIFNKLPLYVKDIDIIVLDILSN